METYEITLSPQTKLTTLHSSQNVFGFLCYLLLDEYGQDFLEQTLNNIKEKNQKLLVSSIMPERSVFWPSWEILYSSNEHFDSVIAKKMKKIRYVSENVLNDLKDLQYIGDALVAKIKDGTYEINKDLLMRHDEIKYTFDVGIDIRYSSKEKTIYNIKSYQNDNDSKFRFFLKTDIKQVIDTIENINHIGLGTGKHASLNVYHIESIREIEMPRGNKSVLISKYIPKNIDDEIDKQTSFCNIKWVHSKPENRMYESYDSSVSDAFSVINEGSLLVPKEDFIGTLRKRENASAELGKPIYYNGNAFLYPLEMTTWNK